MDEPTNSMSSLVSAAHSPAARAGPLKYGSPASSRRARRAARRRPAASGPASPMLAGPGEPHGVGDQGGRPARVDPVRVRRDHDQLHVVPGQQPADRPGQRRMPEDDDPLDLLGQARRRPAAARCPAPPGRTGRCWTARPAAGPRRVRGELGDLAARPPASRPRRRSPSAVRRPARSARSAGRPRPRRSGPGIGGGRSKPVGTSGSLSSTLSCTGPGRRVRGPVAAATSRAVSNRQVARIRGLIGQRRVRRARGGRTADPGRWSGWPRC